MGFLQDMLEKILYEASVLWVALFQVLGRTVFYVEEGLTLGDKAEALDNLFTFVQVLGISLIILKVLQKGFFTYVLWKDGDPDVPIQKTITNIVIAVVACVSFPTIYSWYADISLWILEQVSFFSFDLLTIENWSEVASLLIAMNSIMGLITLIYIIMLFVLYLQFLARSASLLMLRIGFPLACLGLLDSDNGVFTSTVKIFFQNSLTTIAQLFFMMLSMTIYFSGMSNTNLINPFLCIACCSAAFATPKLLQSILLPTGSGGGVGSKVSTASQAVTLFKNFAGK